VSQELMRKAVESALKKEVPDFQVGDTVGVHCRIVEGDKERTQVFTGTVIARRGAGISEMFTVRRIVNNEGVERMFPLHSPKVGAIDVVRSGRTRRAKLYFLRERVGKATRLKEGRRTGKAKKELVVPGDETAAAASKS
jgi:large subunit ribosomal protein L19